MDRSSYHSAINVFTWLEVIHRYNFGSWKDNEVAGFVVFSQ